MVRRGNRPSYILVATCVLLAALLLGTGKPERGEEGASRFSTEVVKADLSIEVELAGTFVAEDKDEIRIEPKSYRGELIITALKAEGASVKEGEVLMEFDPSSLERSLEDGRNDASDKQVALDKASADLEAFEIERETTLVHNEKELELARGEVEKAREEATIELESKLKSIKDSEHQLADGKIDLEQLTQLYQERELHTSTENILIARERRRIENLEHALEKTKRGVEIWKKFDQTKTIAEKDLEAGKKDAELRKAKIKLDADRAEKSAEVKKAQRALDKAQREVGELEEDAKALRVLSPRDGIVFFGAMGGGDSFGGSVVIFGGGGPDKEMRIGGRVRTHQILMTVASMERLSVQMSVLENDIQHMKPNLPITVRPDAFPSLVIPGKLTKVDLVASRAEIFSDVREFTMTGEYEGVFRQLRSGMNCRVTVHADTVPDAVQVPVLAVFSEGGEFYCLAIRGGETSRRAVKLGATNGTVVEITEGLRPGDVVTLWDPSED